MKDDENKPDMKTWIDPELEARVVAWVAGEASPFEIAELERIVAAQPELAVFKRRIEAVHGLVREAVRPEATPLLLAPERRAKLLAVLEGAEKTEPVVASAGAAPEKRKVIPFGPRLKRAVARYAWIGGVAATAAVGLFLATRKVYMRSEAKIMANNARSMNALPTVVQIQGVVDQEKRKETVDASMAAPDTLIAQSFAPQPPPPAGIDYYNITPSVALESKDLSRMKGLTLGLESGAKQSNYAYYDQKIGGGGGQSISASDRAKARDSAVAGIVDFNSLSTGARSDADHGVAASGLQSRNFGMPAGKPLAAAPKSLAAPSLSIVAGSGAMIGGLGGAASGSAYTGALTITGSNVVSSGGTLAMNESVDALAGSPPIKMDPFVVKEEAQGSYGYMASSTLSGSRLAMPVAPMPSPPPIAGLGSVVEDALTLSPFEVASAPKKGGRGGFSASFGVGKKTESPPTDTIAPASPFTVSGAADTGYVATGTLAGTRLRSELKDLAASISVTTKAFMEDSAVIAENKPVATDGEHAKQLAELSSKLEEEKKAAAAKETDDQKRPAPAMPAEPPSTEETSTAKEPVSTFSLHVSDVSFRLAQSALARGQLPDASLIRPEEIYNAFDYGDPSPATAEKVGCRIEQSAHPFLQQRNLVRLAVKVPATGRGAAQPLRLTVLLDTSGSMEREDRVATVRRALEVLVSLLGPQDRITLVGFARTPRLLAVDVAGDRASSLLDLVTRTPAEGGTNLEAALKLGGELARRHQQLTAQNRIVVLTDGAANLGDADPARLAAMVEELRQQGIAFDACGVGLNGLDDAMLEPLTRKGDGRYYVLDTPESADAGFARQLAGAFRPAAENVKLQVRFNPARVANYRLIGFEKHRLKTEDFRNDRVDAAELAAEEAAVAVYQIEALPSGEGELGEVSVRFRDPASGAMVERSWTMSYDAHAPAFDRATPSLQLAGAAALVAEKLRGGPFADQFKLGDFAAVVHGLRGRYPSQGRVQEFVTMFDSLRRIRGE